MSSDEDIESLDEELTKEDTLLVTRLLCIFVCYGSVGLAVVGILLFGIIYSLINH